jgi:hypothetical protein
LAFRRFDFVKKAAVADAPFSFFCRGSPESFRGCERTLLNAGDTPATTVLKFLQASSPPLGRTRPTTAGKLWRASGIQICAIRTAIARNLIFCEDFAKDQPLMEIFSQPQMNTD